jgi:hypothetical protein
VAIKNKADIPSRTNRPVPISTERVCCIGGAP